jgi:long-chain acyl-CoA synthetase
MYALRLVSIQGRTRPFNRLRAVLDRGLSPENILDRACAAHPDNVLFHPDSESELELLRGAPLTPRRLRTFAGRLGTVLHEAGMRPGDRVAISKTNHVDYFFLVLAIVRAGGVAVPVNGGMEGGRLAHYLDYTGARILISDARTFGERIGDPARLPGIETWMFPEPPPGFTAEHVHLNHALA